MTSSGSNNVSCDCIEDGVVKGTISPSATGANTSAAAGDKPPTGPAGNPCPGLSGEVMLPSLT